MPLNLEAFRATPLNTAPYPHLVVPGFLGLADVAAAIRDFPRLDMAGLFLPEAAEYGPAFARLLEEMESAELRDAVGEKLGLDLRERPTLVTVRARCQDKDGRIHADSKFKLATLLLYLNEPWESEGGRLRILRSGEDIEDYAAEVPPAGGTLVCFKVQANSWHGHKPFVGPRRYLMVNYCQNDAVRDSEMARHRLSGQVKKIKRVLGLGPPRPDASAFLSAHLGRYRFRC